MRDINSEIMQIRVVVVLIAVSDYSYYGISYV